ncbi:MAG TPA: cytochrome P450 [Kofleriaceae bacterium]|nr:cytochrome P450 [Kofleriaceae bacterium]
MTHDELPAFLDGFDLADQRRFGDGFPHQVFARIRAEAPIFFHPGKHTADGEGFWVLSRHADVAAAGADPVFSSQGGGGRSGGGTHIDDLAPGVNAGVLINMMDDPRHRVIRDQLRPGLDATAIAALEPELRELAHRLVAEAAARGRGDLVADVAAPFALRTALTLLGAPASDRPRLAGWANVSMGFDDRLAGRDTQRSQIARLAMFQYGSALLGSRAAAPAHDFASRVARAELPAASGQPPMSQLEREVFFPLIMGAGTESPRNAIAAGILALAEHPASWRALREDPALLPGAIEEMMRWSSPTPYNRRTATRDVDFRGAKIAAGQKVTLWWASANRDERVFEDPFRFDIRRSPNPHLALGSGIHACMGPELGRLELRLVLEALLARVESIALDGRVQWAPSNKHTVVLEAPVIYTPAASAPAAPTREDLGEPSVAEEPGIYLATRFLPVTPFDPVFRADPYRRYRELAAKGPVVRTGGGIVVVTGHPECAAALKSPHTGWGDGQIVAEHFMRDTEGKVVRQFIFMDPPEHTRLRSLVSKAFTPRLVERLRPVAERLVRELIAAAGSSFDLMDAIAHPLPAMLLADMMGVPAADVGPFRAWSAAIGRGLDPDIVLTRDQVAARQGAREQFNRYFTELAAERRKHPTGDLVSALVAVEDGGTRLTEGELVTSCTLIMSAGYALTVHLIGNGMLALLRHPAQRAWLRANPDRLAGAVEELLRYDPPAQMISRLVLADTDLAGSPVKAGEILFLILAAANRDPRVYTAPDELDLARGSERNLGFGHGIHYCLGAPLARLTAQVAIGALAGLDLAIADPGPAQGEGMVVRGLARLPVTLAGAP